jgi:hypothetical protein
VELLALCVESEMLACIEKQELSQSFIVLSWRYTYMRFWLLGFTLVSGVPWWLGHPHLDTVTLRPALSNTVMNRPTNVHILRQSNPTGVGLSDHPQTARFDPLEVGLNVGCDNPTQPGASLT